MTMLIHRRFDARIRRTNKPTDIFILVFGQADNRGIELPGAQSPLVQ